MSEIEFRYCIECNEKKEIEAFRINWWGSRSYICRSCNIKDGENPNDADVE